MDEALQNLFRLSRKGLRYHVIKRQPNLKSIGAEWKSVTADWPELFMFLFLIIHSRLRGETKHGFYYAVTQD